MPEYAPQRLGPRSALPPASTGYEIAQVVKAAPTDPYSPTAAGPSKANDLLQALGVLDKTITPVAIEAGKALVARATKKGAQARFVGDALAPNASNAFIDGYERMDGQYKGVQFSNAAKEYAVKNSHLDPEEFQKGLDELQKTYVGQLVHQGQLDTFLPDAIKGGEHATATYQDAKNVAIVQERNQKVQDIFDGKFTISLDQTALDVLGIPLSKGFKSIATDATSRKAYDDNKDAFRAAMSPQIRAILDDARTQYKSLGMTTRDLSANLLGRIGRMAADVGAPGLLDYAYQKNAADGNMSVETAFPAETNKYADQARAMDTQISTAMLVKQEKEKKAALEKRTGDWLMELANPNVSMQTAEKIWIDVWNEKELDPGMKLRLANHAADVMLGQGFALKDNQAVARDLEDKIMTGKVSGSEAFSAVLAASHSLSQSTYRYLMGKVSAINNRKGDTAKDRSWAMFQSESGVYRSSLIKTLSVTDDMGKVMLGLDYSSQVALRDITSNGIGMWYRGIEELAKANGGLEDNIPGEALQKLHDRIVTFYRPQVDMVVKTANPDQGYGAPPTDTTKRPPSTKTGKIADLLKAGGSAVSGELPPGIPPGYTDTGKTIGGKRAFVSPDGKMIEVEK